MTEKQFFASKWKAFEIMTVFIKDIGQNCECYLVGIDFEDKIMKLRPINIDMYQDDIYEIRIHNLRRGKVLNMRILK